MGPSGARGSIAVTQWPARTRAQANSPSPQPTSRTRAGGSPIWPRTNSSTCRCQVAGSPMILRAHSRIDGDVRGAVHYQTILPRSAKFRDPLDPKVPPSTYSGEESFLTPEFYSINLLNI